VVKYSAGATAILAKILDLVVLRTSKSRSQAPVTSARQEAARRKFAKDTLVSLIYIA